MVTTAVALAILHSPLLLAAGIVVFLLPGAVLLTAMHASLRLEERLAWWFAASLVLLTATFALAVALRIPIDAAPSFLAGLTLAAALAARRFAPRPVPLDASDRIHIRPAHFLLGAATVACVEAAVAFAPVGSVDRWWYLAYVRGYLGAAPLSLAEPFLGTGEVFARFGFHPWLFGLAMWSQLSGVDPVEVYEHWAPVLAVLVSVSATIGLAIEMFGRTARTRLTILATMLLWSGGLVPVLARAGEDKVLAASALLPLCLAAFLRVLREGRGRVPHGSLVLLFVAAAATASVHALAHAFVLVALVPAAAMFAVLLPQRRAALSLAVTVLLAVAVAPAVSGLVVTRRLSEIGADLAHADHPVVRVHEARDRLVELPAGGYAANPRLLFHPLSLLALAGVLSLASRNREVILRRVRMSPQVFSSPASDAGPARTARHVVTGFLLVTTVVPVAMAFLPPLPMLLGSIIPPWMVYRVLWLVPLAPLAALAADSLAARFPRREAVATLLLLALGIPSIASSAATRLSEVRERLAPPPGDDFAGMLDAVRSLPAGALVVAAPELSERLPALTGRHVVAALDRSTIVFTGSRERGEARLRARAALLTGDDDGPALARAAGVEETHAVYDPRAERTPRCVREIRRGEAYAVCELAREEGAVTSAEALAPATSGRASSVLAEATCTVPATIDGKRNPWAAAPPLTRCRVEWGQVQFPLAGIVPVPILHIDAGTGRATDELRISVRDGAGREHRAVVRTDGDDTVELALPTPGAGDIDIAVASSFLPSVHPKRVAILSR